MKQSLIWQVDLRFSVYFIGNWFEGLTLVKFFLRLQKYKTFTYKTTNLAKKLLNQIFSEKHGHAISLIYSKNLKWKYLWWRRDRDIEIKKTMYNSSLVVLRSPYSPHPSCGWHCCSSLIRDEHLLCRHNFIIFFFFHQLLLRKIIVPLQPLTQKQT